MVDLHEDITKKEKKEERARGCQAIGEAQIACSGKITVAHILTAVNQSTRAARGNILFICEAHQYYFNHRVPYVWYRFVKDKFPEKLAYIVHCYDLVIKEYRYILEVAKEK